ncbi:DUF1702 family protein [Agromyces intestinalis]
MVDFRTRGFLTHDARAREHLEERAHAFITGFNLAANDWAGVHEALAGLPDELRGFAYEGAGMYGGLLGTVRGRAATATHLLSYGGARYPHLIHVGWGWGSTPLRTAALVPLAPTPVLKWLGLDGAGFGLGFFCGTKRALRIVERARGARRTAMVAGVGRSLWFANCADPGRIADLISSASAVDTEELWAGVGLAAAYAGAPDPDASRVRHLAELSGRSENAFRQGLLFGVVAHHTSGHSEGVAPTMASNVLGLSPRQATAIADDALEGLAGDESIAAYEQWRRRVREAVAA